MRPRIMTLRMVLLSLPYEASISLRRLKTEWGHTSVRPSTRGCTWLCPRSSGGPRPLLCSSAGYEPTRLRSKTRRGIYQRRLGKTAAPFRRGPCRKLAVGLGPAARPGTATSIFTPLSSMRWNYRAHLSSEFDVLLMLEHELVAEDELDGRHPSMSSMVPDATASTTKHGGPLETHHDDQAPPSTLRRRVVSDPGPTIPAAGGTVETADHGLQ